MERYMTESRSNEMGLYNKPLGGVIYFLYGHRRTLRSKYFNGYLKVWRTQILPM